MQGNNRILDDIAKVASGAFSTVAGIRDELEAMVRQQIERVTAQMDLVQREEFEAVRAMAAKAREEQEALLKRVAELEARLAAPPAKKATAAAARKKAAARNPRKSATKKPAAKT